MKIYLAGPISGKSYDEVVTEYSRKTEILQDFGYEVLCPMTGKGYLRNELELKPAGYNSYLPPSTSHAIFERDRWMVSQCDVMLADLSQSGDRVSIGTMMELAWASMLGKHVVAIVPDGNVHKHAFVIEAADIVYPDLDDAVIYLHKLIRGNP
jgi:nucleoside 2-deoxyribosyltransferase